MNKRIIAIVVAVLMVVFVFASCQDAAETAETAATETEAAVEETVDDAAATETETAEEPAEEEPAEEASADIEYGSNIKCDMPAWYKEPTEERRTICTGEPGDYGSLGYASGRYGDKATSYEEINLTDEQVEQVKGLGLKAAICMGFTGDDWSAGIVYGIKEECERLGIEIIAETEADFKDTKQISDLHAVAASKPDIIFTHPVNPLTETAVYQEMADQGIRVVFIDQQAENMEPGKDFISVVTADNYGIGIMIADELAKAIGGKGDVASLYYNPDFYVTNCRFEGFIDRIREYYPEINVIDVEGFDDWQNAQDATAALLTKYPDLLGMYGSWDVPAVGVVAAAKLSDRTPEDFAVTIEDLGNEMALNLASGGFIKGVGAQQTHLQGHVQADVAALDALGEAVPAFIVVPGLDINIDNLDTEYPVIYGEELPADVAEALEQTRSAQ